ncbi:MAG: hypothetical protein ABWK53_04700 [Anaerolineales bacterium]
MLKPTDLIRLPYTPDLTEGGIAYACRSLAYTYNRMGGSPLQRLRRIVAGVAVELAFRRFLGEQAVPFDVLGATPFTQPDRYDVSLGGHRCDLKSYHISRRRQIALIRRDPGRLLEAPALVPLDQYTAEGHRPDDIYLFAFLLGVIAASHEDAARAQAAGQPLYLMAPLPDLWARPPAWLPLNTLSLKSECDQPLRVELGGQDAERRFITWSLDLPPRRRVLVPGEWYTVAYLHCQRRPEARLGIHSPQRGAAHIVHPHEWGNIWVYGMDIFLAGWMTHQEFRRKAFLLKAGASTFQYTRTRTKNLALPVAELAPLVPLLQQVRAWESVRKNQPGGET